MDSESEINRKEPPKEEEEEDRFSRLPHELAAEILSRLPISSVIKFRFASRSGNLMSRDIRLAKMLMSRSLISQRTCLIFHCNHLFPNELHFVEFSGVDDDDDETVRKFDIPFVNLMPEFRVIGSCNGLLCLIGSDFSCESTIYVYNPFTRYYIRLPKPMTVKSLKAEFGFGFGFDPVTEEYKVIIIAYELNVITPSTRYRSAVQTYNLSRNKWSRIGKAPYRVESGSIGVLVSGRLHWMGKSEKYNNFIVSFDLSNDSFEMLKLDTIIPTLLRSACYLVVLGECLSVALPHPTATSNRGYIDVWVMKEYGKQESWLKMYTFNSGYVFPPYRVHRVVCLLKSGAILFECDFGHLVSYNQDTQTFNMFRFQGMPKAFSTTLHVGSLCPVVKS